MFGIKRFGKNTPLLIFTFNFMPIKGGIQKYSFELVGHLHAMGYSPVILARTCPGDKSFDIKQPYRIIRMKWVGLRWLRLLPMTLYFLYVVIRYRIVLVHCINWIPCGYIARFFRYLLFYRYIITCHGGEVTKALKWPHRIFLRSALKQASWLIAGNNFIRETLNRLRLPKTPVSVIGFGVDNDFFRPDLDAEFLKTKFNAHKKTVLLTVAELKKRKGMDNTLQALASLDEDAKNFIFLIVGQGPDRERLEGLVKINGLEEQVYFTGPLSDKDLRFHYSLCDIYIMPNRAEADGDIEGFGIVFLEAAACEKPVIAGNSGGVPDAVVHGKTGFLVNPNSVDEIAEKITWLAHHPAEARAMGKNGRDRAASLFTWSAIASKTEMIYSKIFTRAKRI
jgi:phosphatidylinositol alpha-1,6-mannosyltransferase